MEKKDRGDRHSDQSAGCAVSNHGPAPSLPTSLLTVQQKEERGRKGGRGGRATDIFFGPGTHQVGQRGSSPPALPLIHLQSACLSY